LLGTSRMGAGLMTVRLAALSLLALAALSLAACGSSPPDGVLGLAVVRDNGVSVSPAPLPAGFGESDGSVVPDPGALVVISSDATDKEVARVRADAEGIFRAELPPGAYSVRGADLPNFFAEPLSVAKGAGQVRLIVQTAERE
jgi:hypothetical protein